MYKDRDDWEGDPHRFSPDVHYRLYASPVDGSPVVICVQDFDYLDHDARRILSPYAYSSESDAEMALYHTVIRFFEQASDRVSFVITDPDLRGRLIAGAVREMIGQA